MQVFGERDEIIAGLLPTHAFDDTLTEELIGVRIEIVMYESERYATDPSIDVCGFEDATLAVAEIQGRGRCKNDEIDIGQGIDQGCVMGNPSDSVV